MIADFRAAENLAIAVAVGEREVRGSGTEGDSDVDERREGQMAVKNDSPFPSLVAEASITAGDSGGGEGFILYL